MKRNRIKIPALPQTIVKQASGLYRCSRTGAIFTLRRLQELYSPSPSQQHTASNEGLTREIKPHWTNNYENY